MIRCSTLLLQSSGLFTVTFLGILLAGCGSDSKSQIEQGKQEITEHACASCHGANFAGDTKPQPSSMAYPANLTPDAETGMAEWTTDQIVAAVLNGVDDEGETLCAPMPKFASQSMTTDEAQAIAAYLKSLPAVANAVPESTCPEKK
jgi:mono/diheme cytochrome c family protein